MSQPSSSSYETWVMALRAWSKNPGTPMHHLPALSDDAFHPDTWQRFLKHLNEAINALMDRWNTDLRDALMAAQTDHDIARALTAARGPLLARLELARMQQFPPQFRDQLVLQAQKEIANLQDQLERRDYSGGSRGSTQRSEQERFLRLLRANPLTAVLDMPAGSPLGVPSQPATPAARLVGASGPASAAPPAPTSSPFKRPSRRIFGA